MFVDLLALISSPTGEKCALVTGSRHKRGFDEQFDEKYVIVLLKHATNTDHLQRKVRPETASPHPALASGILNVSCCNSFEH
ncbi:hypothetical protein AVEN_206191-1 [Araneus ventricosus]|uniref:Uncharacterized protein n=1 Tax=Araneus ventricosus TaxID=182803 RepID=A0A4Y2AHP1_ARAVE|nr:hypothetical protein AVEN_206191-1 [Araneus ventricosus]